MEFNWDDTLSPPPGTPVIIFTLHDTAPLRGLLRRLGRWGHPAVIVSTGRFPWELTPSRRLSLFTEVTAHPLLCERPPILYGLGFDGLHSLLLASQLPAGALSGLALGFVSPEACSSFLCRNGVLTGNTLDALFKPVGMNVPPAVFSTFRNWQRGVSPFAFSPEREAWLLELCRQDGAFFRHRYELECHRAVSKCSGLPWLLLGSWSDITASGSLKLSWRLAQSSGTPLDVRFFQQTPDLPEEYGEYTKSTTFLCQWLKNHHLSSKARNYCYFMSEAAGSGAWRRAATWPPGNSSAQIRHLDAGTLSAAPPDVHTAPATIFTGDPALPHQLQGNPLDFAPHPALTAQGIPTAYTDGTAVFSCRVDNGPLTLCGIPRAHLWITSNRTDATIAARLTVQTPPAPGSANLPHPLAISTGICRLALRNDLLVPLLNEAAEQPVAVDFELQPLAYRIPAGSWLRLEISTGETPRYLPRLLTSDRSGISRKVENSVWHTPRYPSRIILPVLNKAPPA